MKFVLVLSVLAVAVTALPVEQERINGETGWYIPQVDGSLEWLDMAAAEQKLSELANVETRYTNTVKFYLYTRANPTTAQEITEDYDVIAASNFNAKNPTRFTIHGWTSSYQDGVNSQTRAAWFSHEDCNMIAVDWARARSIEYASSVLGVPVSAKKVSSLIDFLHSNFGMPFETLEVIGHSLGAHMAGFTGKNVQLGKIHTIIGLDPAMPLYSFDKPTQRLCSTDALYVESIQTNGGTLGFLKPIGKGAFYPNGGQSQPGCGIDIGGGCAHGRSVTYYVESVYDDNFPSMKCSDYKDAVAKDCGSTYSSTRMGAVTNAYMVSGDFYVPVNEAAPFGMGAV